MGEHFPFLVSDEDTRESIVEALEEFFEEHVEPVFPASACACRPISTFNPHEANA